MRISFALVLALLARTVSAVCPSTLLYRAPIDPWAAIESFAFDDRAIYVAHQITLPGPHVIRRIDRTTEIVSDVATLSSGVGLMISVPPLLFFLAAPPASSIDLRPALYSIGPNGKNELTRVARVGRTLRSDGKYLYWLVASTAEHPGPTPVYRRDGEIQRIPISGGAIEIVASGLLLTPQHDMVITGDDLILLNSEGLFRVVKTGGTPRQIVAASDLAQITKTDESGIVVTAILPGEGLNGTDRAEVRRIAWSGDLVQILGFVTFPQYIDSAVALVDGDRIFFYVYGFLPRLAGPIGGLFLIENGNVTIFADRPWWPFPLDVRDGFLYVVSPDSFSSGFRRIERMCAAPLRGRVAVRR
jgi:hypothetical protein